MSSAARILVDQNTCKKLALTVETNIKNQIIVVLGKIGRDGIVWVEAMRG
jgi:hypothetical protein